MDAERWHTQEVTHGGVIWQYRNIHYIYYISLYYMTVCVQLHHGSVTLQGYKINTKKCTYMIYGIAGREVWKSIRIADLVDQYFFVRNTVCYQHLSHGALFLSVFFFGNGDVFYDMSHIAGQIKSFISHPLLQTQGSHASGSHFIGNQKVLNSRRSRRNNDRNAYSQV